MLKHLSLVVFLGAMIIFSGVTAQSEKDKPQRDLRISYSEKPITVDGVLNEKVWENAQKADQFFNKWPSDVGMATSFTEVQVAYDQNFLYIAATCFDGADYVIQSLKRDRDYWDSDGFAVVLDPVARKTNGFFFGLNALNVQTEALVSDDEDYATDWDNKWFSAIKNHPDRYQIEIAIPFKTLRYEEGKTEWRINFIRNDIKNNMYSTWSFVPLNFNGFNLGYTGTLIWDKAPPKVKGNISIIPYLIGGATKDYEGQTDTNWKGNAGVDAKIAISSSLNMDVTVNPDFSQVDVDQQVTNLDRFDLFFPERRTFFLENSDLMDGYGIPPTRPFFSRRIGLRNGVPLPIYFGARLSGNLNKDWRVAMLSVQTAAKGGELGQNYSVGTFQRRIHKRSSLNGIVLSRQAFDETGAVGDDYTRNVGMEFNYTSESGKWASWGQFHTSFAPEEQDERNFYCAGFEFADRTFSHTTSYSHTGADYLNDLGFNARQYNYDAARDTSIRLGYNILFQEMGYVFIPKNTKKINRHGPSLESVPIFNTDFSLNEYSLALSYVINFQNQSRVTANYNFNVVNLPFATDLIGGDVPLPAAHYNYQSVGAGYESDSRKAFSFEAEVESGSFYNGTKNSFGVGLKYRQQPWGNFSLDLTRDQVSLPDDYGKTVLYLISPKVEISFSRSLFWTTFFQYNTQADNFNINSRIQWRFKPMSDLFIVYTDNYAVENLAVKNRGIVLKLNYWLTL